MSSVEIGNNVDIDHTVQLGKGVILRDNVNMRNVIIEDGVKIGRNTIIFGKSGNPVRIGRSCYISPNCYFNGAEGLIIEPEVTIAPNVQIFTDSGPNVGPLRKVFPIVAASIRIKAGSWIGAGSILLPGANIGENCVLAANSTLKESMEDGYIYAGSLAKPIKKVDI